MTETIKFDWSQVASDAMPEILKQAETCLAATVALATAADQRATRLTSMLGNAGVALLAGVIALASRTPVDSALIASGATTSLLLFAASFLAAMAARPTKFHIAGYEPRLLLKGASDKIWMERYIVEDAQCRINKNRKALDRAAWLATAAMYTAAFAVFAGVAVFLISRA